VSGLIDPDPAVRADSRNLLPPRLAQFANWEIFDLAVTLAGIHLRRASVRIGAETIVALFEAPDWSDSLAFVGDVLLNWPDGMPKLLAAMRANSTQRKGHFGIVKELGPLAKFGRREGLTPRLSGEVKAVVVEHYKAAGRNDTRSSYELSEAPAYFIRYTDALAKYRLDVRQLKRLLSDGTIEIIRADQAGRAPVYIRESQIQDAIAIRKELVRLTHFGQKMRVPAMVSASLAASGHIRLETGPAARLRGTGNQWVRSSELSNFQARVEGRARPNSKADVELVVAMRQTDVRGPQVIPLLRASLDGELPFALANGKFRRLNDIRACAEDVRRWCALKPLETFSWLVPERMTVHDAAIYLGVHWAHVLKLLDARDTGPATVRHNAPSSRGQRGFV
jgi:hypothetical protein